MSHAIGDAFAEACIDIMSEDLEMDAEDIANELEACGYEAEEAEQLAQRPWTKLAPLIIPCAECPNDRLELAIENEGEVAISAFHREGDPDGPGFTDEVVIWLNRGAVEQVHSWLGAWLAR